MGIVYRVLKALIWIVLSENIKNFFWGGCPENVTIGLCTQLPLVVIHCWLSNCLINWLCTDVWSENATPVNVKWLMKICWNPSILHVYDGFKGILANAIDRPPNNCLSFKTINCTETYLKLYSHYPENAANSHTVFTFSSSSSLLEISLCISRDVF